MAKNVVEEEQHRSTSGGKRRLARAKVKRGDSEEDALKGKPLSAAARAKKRKETARNIGITVFAIVIAFAMALPSLSTIFANNQQNVSAQDAAEGASDADADSDESEEKEGMDKVDQDYKTTIDPLEAKLEDDPEDLATILNLGNDYMQWAYAASSYSSDEESQDHVNEIFEKAIEYFDRYLELNDSVAVKVNRALCVFYSAGSEDGIEDMTKLTEDYPDYAPAWGNLGLLYESTYDLDKAKETYQKAAEVDADDTYGVKSFANRRLASMNSSSVENTSDTITSTTPTSLDTETGTTLTDDLLSKSDTAY